MHAAPHAPWTVASLADRVGLSRSVFAARFKDRMSKSPMHYLFEFRMGLACGLIADGRSGVKQIATQLGYASRDAFSSAFKRWRGLSPGAYRRLSANCADPEDDNTP
jgi:AraC-like DNA-binding protein